MSTFVKFSTRQLCLRTYSDFRYAVNKLTETLGTGKVSTANYVRDQHGRDESYHRPCLPDVVVFPADVLEVSCVAKICSEHNVAMIPFGTGTGMEGGVISLKGGVSVDLTKINQVIDYHPEDFNVTVQPGVTRLALNEYLRGDGLWFPVDPGADASLCGMAATRASGTNAVRYGTMKENVVNLQVVLADGTIIDTAGKGRRTRKSSAGYNLTNLFVGSEGTLGFITSATLKLYGVPDSVISAVCQFDSIKLAVDAVQEVLQCGIPIARIELLDEILMMATNRYSKLSYAEKPSLFLEFHGSEQHTKEQSHSVATIMARYGGSEFLWAQDRAERDKLWKARHNALYAIKALRPGTDQISTDVCVPISRLTEIIMATKQDLVNHNIIAPVLGHVGDGNFHVTLLFDPRDTKEKLTIDKITDRLVIRALSMDGTCTGEHGVGIGKRKYLAQEVGQDCVNIMKGIKKLLDPKGLMNPAKVLPD